MITKSYLQTNLIIQIPNRKPYFRNPQFVFVLFSDKSVTVRYKTRRGDFFLSKFHKKFSFCSHR